jgi:hypothetical protein
MAKLHAWGNKINLATFFIELTLFSRVVLENLVAVQLVKKILLLMTLELSLPGFYLEWQESNQLSYKLFIQYPIEYCPLIYTKSLQFVSSIQVFRQQLFMVYHLSDACYMLKQFPSKRTCMRRWQIMTILEFQLRRHRQNESESDFHECLRL